MIRLEMLFISETDLTGLEYLPLGLKDIFCDGKIKEELKLCSNNLSLWQEAHQKLMKKAGQEPIILDYTGVEPQRVTAVPNFLQEELDEEVIISENYNPELNYSSFLLRDSRSFA